MAPFISQCYPGVRHGIPKKTGLLGAELIWCKACLECHACLSSEWHSVIKYPYSNPAQGRSARFVSAWSGGEVETPGWSNVVAAASPAPPGPVLIVLMVPNGT